MEWIILLLCAPHRNLAVLAFKGKEIAMLNAVLDNKRFYGDIHIEPLHGANMSWSSINGLAHFGMVQKSIYQGNTFI